MSKSGMRILRGLSSRVLECGCLVGVYETYDGDVVTILDAKGPACAERAHYGDEPLAPGDIPESLADQSSSSHRDDHR